MKRSFLRRALSGASVLVVTLGSTLFLVAGQAQAYTCAHSANHTITNNTGVSHATFTLNWGCSDGHIHWNGTLYDDKCDARAGRIVFIGGWIPTLGDQWEWAANAGNGCGTHSTFTASEPNLSYPTIEVDVYACNSTNCSSYLPVTYTV